MTSPDHFRNYLTTKLINQRTAMVTANAYYSGTQALQFLDPDIARMMEGRVRNLNVNFARLVCDVLAQRLTVTGFASRNGGPADEGLWRIWQANNLDEQSLLAHTDALVYGRAFYLAWAGPDGSPSVTAESPLQCAVARDAMTGAVTAGIKRWLDDEGYARALVLTADQVTEYASRDKNALDTLVTARSSATMATTWGSESMQVVRQEANPLGVVPMVALVNRPRLLQLDGESELTDVMPLIDGIAKLSTDMMLSSEVNASPRRWVTGIHPDGSLTREQADEAADRIRKTWEKAHAAKFLIAPDDRTSFGQFTAATLENFETGIRMLTGQIAAIAALPSYYVGINTVNPASADAIRSSEARLTAKAEQRQAQWSGPYEELMRLAVLIRDGQADPSLEDLQTLWKSAEPSTIAQSADAASKLYASGLIDRRTALVELGYAPQDVDRIEGTTTTEGMIA